MKRTQLLAFALTGLLTTSALGTMAFRAVGQAPARPAQVQTQQDTDTETADDPGGEQAGNEVNESEETGAEQRDPAYTGSIAVDESKTAQMTDAEEAAALAGQAKITSEQAQAAALAANPGATVTKAEIDNENGWLVYSVQLSNGLDVKVDAGNGAVLHTDTGADEETGETESATEGDQDGDKDNVQDEQDGQPDDANEAPGAEDAGQ